MNELTYDRKISMMRILLDLVKADGRIDEREKALYAQFAAELGLEGPFEDDVEARNSLLALTDISECTREQKEALCRMMGRMIVVDGDIDYNEVRIYNVVNDFCGIGIGFGGYDDPEYIDGGDFFAK